MKMELMTKLEMTVLNMVRETSPMKQATHLANIWSVVRIKSACFVPFSLANTL